MTILFQVLPFLPQEDGTPMNFRYKLASKSKMNVMIPKVPDECADPEHAHQTMRGTMFGAAFHGKYDKLPRTSWSRMVWEVRWRLSLNMVVLSFVLGLS